MVVELSGKETWVLDRIYGLNSGAMASGTLPSLCEMSVGNLPNLGQYNVVLGRLACSFLAPIVILFPRLDCNPA
jgi:hypothetical protein